MVNTAVGIVFESVNHDMSDLRVPNFIAVCFVGSKPPVQVGLFNFNNESIDSIRSNALRKLSTVVPVPRGP